MGTHTTALCDLRAIVSRGNEPCSPQTDTGEVGVLQDRGILLDCMTVPVTLSSQKLPVFHRPAFLTSGGPETGSHLQLLEDRDAGTLGRPPLPQLFRLCGSALSVLLTPRRATGGLFLRSPSTACLLGAAALQQFLPLDPLTRPPFSQNH